MGGFATWTHDRPRTAETPVIPEHSCDPHPGSTVIPEHSRDPHPGSTPAPGPSRTGSMEHPPAWNRVDGALTRLEQAGATWSAAPPVSGITGRGLIARRGRSAVPVRPHTVWMVLGRDRVRGRSPNAISPLNQDRNRAIPRPYAEKHATRQHHKSQPALPPSSRVPPSAKAPGIAQVPRHPARLAESGETPGIRKAERPGGRPPGRSDNPASEWIRSPCRRRRRDRPERGSSRASPRSRPQS
jgi:hypothetical protein